MYCVLVWFHEPEYHTRREVYGPFQTIGQATDYMNVIQDDPNYLRHDVFQMINPEVKNVPQG